MCHKHDDFIKIPMQSGDFLHIPLCMSIDKEIYFFADNSCIIALKVEESFLVILIIISIPHFMFLALGAFKAKTKMFCSLIKLAEI